MPPKPSEPRRVKMPTHRKSWQPNPEKIRALKARFGHELNRDPHDNAEDFFRANAGKIGRRGEGLIKAQEEAQRLRPVLKHSLQRLARDGVRSKNSRLQFTQTQLKQITSDPVFSRVLSEIFLDAMNETRRRESEGPGLISSKNEDEIRTIARLNPGNPIFSEEAQRAEIHEKKAEEEERLSTYNRALVRFLDRKVTQLEYLDWADKMGVRLPITNEETQEEPLTIHANKRVERAESISRKRREEIREELIRKFGKGSKK